MSGLRRDQSKSRSETPIVLATDGPLKVHPLADWNARDVYRYLELHHVPVYVGLLEGKADQRAVVVDALDGRPWDELSDSVTRRLGEVRSHLNG